MHPIKHFITITRHRHMVMHNCFRCGLIWQGLTHDLSKLGFTEFWRGAKYYLGVKSPHYAERAKKGYSEAWMHHFGRNKHHGEYWVDFDPETKIYQPVKMPDKYLAEMVCDRVAASKNYNRKNFKPSLPLEYFYHEGNKAIMHPETRKKLEELLIMYRDEGQKKTFKYIKKNLVHKKKRKEKIE